MTLAQKLSGEITDINSIEFVCKHCGAAVSLDPARWNAVVPRRCPNCPGAKARTRTEISLQNIDHFAVLISQIIKAAPDLPFQIKLNFTLPETQAGKPLCA